MVPTQDVQSNLAIRRRCTGRLPRRIVTLMCLISLTTGCGENVPVKPPTVPIKGKVTYKGNPLTGGDVTFAPSGGGGERRAGSGPIQSDGTFVISSYQSGDGVEAGEYKVFFNPPPPNPDAKTAPVKNPIPAKYRSAKTSPITEMVAEGDAATEVEYKLED